MMTDDVHTRNIKAIAEVQRQMRDDLENHQRIVADLYKTVQRQQQTIQELTVKLALLQHAGTGATA